MALDWSWWFLLNFGVRNPKFKSRIRRLIDPRVGYCTYDSRKGVYRDKAYYYDVSHLQAKGAVAFTSEIVGFMRKWMAIAEVRASAHWGDVYSWCARLRGHLMRVMA